MKLWAALLAACLATAVPAGAAQSSQPLSITIHGDGAQATRLPEYDPSLPIAIRVTDTDPRTISELTVVARGPAGNSIRMPLTRDADGTYSGSLALSDPGPWSLHLTSRAGSLSTDTTPVLLAVQAPPPSNAPFIGVAVGAAIFIVIGGGGFLLLRRLAGPRPGAQLDHAA
jgi:hypothetical protein